MEGLVLDRQMKVDQFFLLEHVAGRKGFLAVSAVVFIELELFL